MRKYLIIAAGVIVVVGIGIVVYFYFFANRSSVTATPGATLTTAGNVTPGGSMAEPGTTSTSSGTPTRVTSRLVRIDSGPVVPGEVAVDVSVLPGGVIATSTKRLASSTPDVSIDYLRRASGNIFSYLVHTGLQTRTSNRTLPGIQSATWLPDGSLALVRYLSGTDFSTINTYALPTNGVGGFFLPQGLAGVDTSANSLLTLASGASGSIATTEKPSGSGGKQAFSTPLGMLRASFAGKGYLAYTKPASALDGYAYLVDAAGNFSRIAGPLPGLTALASPLGNWVLVSWSTQGALKMELINTKTRAVTALPVATITDKCVWTTDEAAIYCGVPINPAASATYPDDWYQGAVSFSDRIWKIDVAGRLAELTLDFRGQTNASLDAEALAIDPNGLVLVFANKNDGSLWSYQL